MYRVVLADDERIIVTGLSRAFPWAEYGCEVAATASDGVEGVSAVRRTKAHILLTDIRMPNMDGLTMVAALKSEFPHLQISVLTAYRDFDYAQQALHLGVCRYLLKPSRMEELREAVSRMTANLAALPECVPEDAEDEAGESGAFIARAALKYIEGHYAEHLSLSEVAQSVYVSQWHLSKLINRHLGRSFLDIVNNLRIERAKALLTDPALRVSEIAYEVGFADVAHFSRNFKKLTGKTPLAYRGGIR